MKIIDTPSPNSSGSLVKPSLIVMHWTGDVSDAGAVSWLTNPASKASAHFVIGRTGVVWQLVPTHKVAWHAGVSSCNGQVGCNQFSIGIEMVCAGEVLQSGANYRTKGTGKPVLKTDVVFADGKCYQRYTQLQLEALQELVLGLVAELPSIKEIVGHSDIAPGRKSDPGPHFPFAKFRSLIESRE